MAKDWTEMTWQEKRQQRLQWWLDAGGIDFVSAQAKKDYQVRVQRLIDVYNVREPDRVPVSVNVGGLPAYLAGTTYRSVMYDADKLVKIWDQFNQKIRMDSLASPAMVLAGKVYDMLDYKLYAWPGHGLPAEAMGMQFVEGEYMLADEYDALIRNPSDFWMRTYIPRIFGAFESFKMLQPFTNIIELPAGHFMPYSLPEVQASLRKLIEIGDELAKWNKVVGQFSLKTLEMGYPATRGAMAKAPFDILGDTLRGTKGIIMDMYRQPDKLLQAIDVITEITIDQTLSTINASRGFMAMFPLHKGDDSFMSARQFEKFYWPSLKKVLEALIAEGILPMLFAEGSYMTRLAAVNEFPKGAVYWMFDKTDMAQAKQALGGNCCISGNIPTSLLITGTPQEVKEYCRKLIETCGRGGGYILASGASIDTGNLDNLRAVMEAAVEYGTYRR